MYIYKQKYEDTQSFMEIVLQDKSALVEVFQNHGELFLICVFINFWMFVMYLSMYV